VTTVRDEGTLGDTDRDHLERAADRGWVILTFDDDFLRLVSDDGSDVDHAGVVYIAQDRHDVGEFVRRIHAALARNEDRELDGRVVYA